MKLICYPTSGTPPRIRPAPSARDWMAATPSAFAYRCLPLNIANSHGWEVLSPCAFSAVWDGGAGQEAIRIDSDAPAHLRPLSHFGSGVLTFHILGLFRTEPGWNLWVGGSPNSPKDGIHALSGVIETDWAPYTFTMNWRFTRPHWPVHFAEGEPICFFFPVPRGAVEACEPEFRALDTDPETAAQYRHWVEGRDRFIRDLGVAGSAAQREKWEKSYYRGRLPDQTEGDPAHQQKLRLKPFRHGGEGGEGADREGDEEGGGGA
ncbi:MAG TPA: DUF6065 family protein [Alphaproteobacteria bacterium]|nr:DUF6065 family protein [Alphaproteobacteria bacterium]